MTSRERVEKSVNHEEPDRVPVDLGGSRLTGIMASAYDKLKKYLGVNGGVTRCYDVFQMLAEVEEPIRRRFNLDVVGLQRLAPAFGIKNTGWKSWRLFDGTEVEVPLGFNPVTDERGDLVLIQDGEAVGRMPNDGYYFDRFTLGVGAQKPNPEDYNPELISHEELHYLQQQAKALYETTDCAILVGLYPGELFFGFGCGKLDEWCLALLTEQDYVREIYEKTVVNWIENLKLYNQAVGDYCTALIFCDDLGMQNGEMISPSLFRELIAPYYKRVFSWVHENTKMKVFFHSCGSIYNMIEILIDCGVDILNPIQCSAANMYPKRLKEEFGDRIVFWGGGCDTQRTLPFGTPDEVKGEVKERLEIFAPGGGFVFNPVHNVQQNTSPENIAAMLDTVAEYGRYA